MRKLFLICFLIWFTSCATYYQRNLRFNQYIQEGEIEEAADFLSQKEKKFKKDRLLFLLNMGVTNSLMGDYVESNQYFEEAYRYADGIQTNYLNEGIAFLTNPMVTQYKGEDFELFYIPYYKALNFLKLNEPEKALVEVKRMDIILNKINDKYKGKNKFKRDAFMHLLMGLIYDANKDYNNAFIAYRNAYNIYEEDYKEMFGMKAPEQLKKDLLRTAYLMGFMNELDYYESRFGMKYSPLESDRNLVFLWHNGLSPVKDEWSINFAVLRRNDNVIFSNNQLGLNFNFNMKEDEYRSSGLSQVEVIRIAFPKYVSREPEFKDADLQVYYKEQSMSDHYSLEPAEDIEQIARKQLHDRMLLELGKGLLRIALKKAGEYKLRQQSQEAGAALGLLNAVTEQADTRHWQTLPDKIWYSRIPLQEGENTVKLRARSARKGSETFSFDFKAGKGQTIFHSFHTLNSMPVGR